MCTKVQEKFESFDEKKRWKYQLQDFYRLHVIKMTQCYFLIKEINSIIVNQTRIIHYKSTHLSRVLRCCKNDQILESCYQQQEEMLRQKKYKYKQVDMIWDIDFSDQ